MNPLVSVVIPAYNPTSSTLKEAIDSALGQTYRQLEVVIVDDGSTVDTRWLLGAYGGRIRYVRKANGGPASARNIGVGLARGEYIAFLDADDRWEPDKIARQVDALQRHPAAGLVYSSVSRIDAHGRLQGVRRHPMARSGWVAEQLLLKNFVPTSTVMVRACCFTTLGRFDESRELISVEDYDMWLRIAERWELLYLDRPLVRYRLHAGGISRNTTRSYLGEKLVVEKAVARLGAASAFVKRVYRRRMAALFFAWGQECFSTNRFREARAPFAASVGYQPWNLKARGYWVATFLGHWAVRLVRRLKAVRRRSQGGRPRRMLHVLFSLNTGGAEHVVLNLARRLDPRRYEVHVCSLTGEGELSTEFRALGVRVHTVTKRPGVDVRLFLELARLIRRQRIELVHTHNATPWLYAGVAAAISGAALYHTEHSNLFAHQRRLRWAERWLAGVTRRIIADSEKVKRHLIDQQGLPARKIVTILNGIDTAAFTTGVPGLATRFALSCNGASPIIGTVGRLAAVKDQATLLEAFQRVVASYPNAVLVIVGDGPMRAELETQARELGIASRVRFLGRRTDIPALLSAFDVFVLSSVSEGLPLTVLEAMAAGVPVVSTDVGALREVLPEPASALLVPPRSPGQLAESIVKVLSDQRLRSDVARVAQRRVVAKFDLSRMVERYEAAYHHEPIS